MNRGRTFVLIASAALVAVLLGGGLMVQVGAKDNSYAQAVLFSEVFKLVRDNYVDPVQSEELLVGAYESMLGALDPNSAYLRPEEVEAWRAGAGAGVAPAFSVLKSGRALQIVAVRPGSAAASSGVKIGDQIRAIDGQEIGDLSLGQIRRRLAGEAGTKVELTLVHPFDDYERETVEVAREAANGPGFVLDEDRPGVARLRFDRLADLDVDALAEELGAIRSRGVEQLLVDLRNLADDGPKEARAVLGLLAPGTPLTLRGHDGAVVDQVEAGRPADAPSAWAGTTAVLVNGATANGAEVLALALSRRDDVKLFGEETFGLGAEPLLVELDNGGALLISARRWELEDGTSWHGSGVAPDEVVRGSGETYAEASDDQLRQVLDLLDPTVQEAAPGEEADAAA